MKKLNEKYKNIVLEDVNPKMAHIIADQSLQVFQLILNNIDSGEYTIEQALFFQVLGAQCINLFSKNNEGKEAIALLTEKHVNYITKNWDMILNMQKEFTN